MWAQPAAPTSAGRITRISHSAIRTAAVRRRTSRTVLGAGPEICGAITSMRRRRWLSGCVAGPGNPSRPEASDGPDRP
jgi:hypothetical protein